MFKMDQEIEMNKQLIKGRDKKIRDGMKGVAGKFLDTKSLQWLELMEKKTKRIQGDYRDTTHDFKKRH